MTALKSSLLNIETMNGIGVGREQSQTASGVNAFAHARVKASPITLLNQANFI